MSSLAQTISIALQAVGPVTGDRLRDIIVDFDGLNLIEEERLAARGGALGGGGHHDCHNRVHTPCAAQGGLSRCCSDLVA